MTTWALIVGADIAKSITRCGPRRQVNDDLRPDLLPGIWIRASDVVRHAEGVFVCGGGADEAKGAAGKG